MRFRLIIDPSKDEEVLAIVHSPSPLTDQIEFLVSQHPESQSIMGFTEDGQWPLRFRDIACITVLNGKTYAIDSKNRRYRLKQRLYELEEILPGSFIRINKSSIANEDHLEGFTAAFSGAVDAVFRCGYREYVSRRCFAQIKRRYTL